MTGGGAWVWPLVLLALACGLWQLVYIWPYSRFSAKEMQTPPPGSRGDDLRVMACNVLMENRAFQKVRDEIAAADPDVLLLMETDQRWADELAPALAAYSAVWIAPLDNHYGMIFATRLEVESGELIELTEDATPTAFATLRSKAGQRFRFVGLHPVPPVPGEDTERRDAQVLYAARFARDQDCPVLVMGDFNTVAWSKAAHRFKIGGGYHDPRIGRGPLHSFDARRWWMRFPIDQLYVSGGAVLVRYHRGANVGSDHFPMHAVLRFDADLAARLNQEILPLAEESEARIAALVAQHGARLDAHRRAGAGTTGRN